MAKRYPYVRHFLVWNEFKGFFDDELKRWDAKGYPDVVEPSSFLKERGWSRPRLVVFSLVCELPDPGWRVEIGVGGQGSGGARPRKRPQGLDGDAVRRTLFQDRRIGKGLCCFRLADQGVGVVFKAGFPAWAGEGLLGHSFAAR